MRFTDDCKFNSTKSELSVRLITPFCASADALRLRALAQAELIIALPENTPLADEIEQAIKTDIYANQSAGREMTDSKRALINRKTEENARRKESLISRIRDDFASATFLLNGERLSIPSDSPKTCMYHAVTLFIEKTYPSLPMAGDRLRSDKDIAQILKNHRSGTRTAPALDRLSPAEEQIINAIRNADTQHKTYTVKTLTDHFEHIPFGWNYGNILCFITELLVRNKIGANFNNRRLETDQWEKTVLTQANQDHIYLRLLEEITPQDCRKLEKFIQDFFGIPVDKNADGHPLIKLIKEQAEQCIRDHDTLRDPEKRKAYPFLKESDTLFGTLETARTKSPDNFIREFDTWSQHLCDSKEDIPMNEFMKDDKRKIYDTARRLLRQKASNLNHLSQEDAQKVRELESLLQDPAIYRNGKLPTIKRLTEFVSETLNGILTQERRKALAELRMLQSSISLMDGFDIRQVRGWWQP